jgi:anionic cell wall polymer biosynthesis LytR-Cps2A-Psr (LCP) family protein
LILVTIILLKMPPFPQDTQVEIPGVGVDKINDANVGGGARSFNGTEEDISRALSSIPV